MAYFTPENKFRDEIEDTGGLGDMICMLLLDSSRKDELMEIFNELLSDDCLDELDEVCRAWKDEQSDW